MKYYWINIDTACKRREFMENQFKKLDIENYRISAFTPENIDFSKIIKNKDSTNIPTEYACILSHLEAIKRGYDDGDEYFIILEDDMNVEKFDDNKITKILNDYNKTSNNGIIEMLQIFNSAHPCIIQMYNDYFIKENKLIIKRDVLNYPGMGCYLLSHDGAKKIIDKFILSNNNDFNYDLSLSDWCCSDNILYKQTNTFVFTYPFVTTCSDFESHIHNDHIVYHKMANDIINKIHNLNNLKYLII